MSGGSFNYMFTAEAGRLLAGDYDYELKKMAKKLDELGAQDLAEVTRNILKECKHERDQLENQLYDAFGPTKLAKVWKAVEWWLSNDFSEAQVRDAIEEYRIELRYRYRKQIDGR